MKKRYQIFVSSTFADLEVERGKVMQTILNFDCFPAGMELFPAMDEEIFEYIKRIIDDSDYYLLIIGGRYGDVDESGVSWTEKEFDYAVSKHIPIIAFDHKDFTKLPAEKTDQDDKKRKKLLAFKKKVATKRLIGKWSNADDLALTVATSLKTVLELQPRTGWVRAGIVASADVQQEIDKLLKEIAAYKNKIKKLEADLEKNDVNQKQSKKMAEQKIDELQETIAQLQDECNELEAQKEKSKYDRDAVERSYKEKVDDVASDLEKVLDKLKGNKEPKKSLSLIETITVPGTDVSFRMVRVEGGAFKMGANEGDDEALSREKPAHQVILSDYYIGETQVTQALWEAVMNENPSRFKGDAMCPVERVSWYDCQRFIEKLNERTGKSFRLPSEAQWEFAARGGNKSKEYKYAGGNDLSKVAWYDDNSKDKTHPVGQKAANELGIYDMSGNVWEWCQDRYGGYTDVQQTDSEEPENGSDRVYRGGSWDDGARLCRVSYRRSFAPKNTGGHLGLRLAL